MIGGWIKIHRSMKEHWIFSNAEYLRAWVIILMEVNHTDKKVLISGKLLECKKGESLKSLDTWGTIFGGWSKNKVYRFFNLLKKDNMIDIKSETVTTRLRVCNYCKYQSSENVSGTGADMAAEHQAEPKVKRTRNTNKNGKNSNNGKNEKKKTDFDKFWDHVEKKTGRKNALTQWNNLGSSRPTTDFLIERLVAQQNYVREMESKGKWVKALQDPERWLKNHRWEDEIPTQKKRIPNPIDAIRERREREQNAKN